MSTRDEYVERMKRQLDEWNKDIDKLQERLGRTREAASEQLRSRLTEARAEYADLLQKVDKIRQSDKPWESLKDEAEHVWKVLKQSAKYFRSQL